MPTWTTSAVSIQRLGQVGLTIGEELETQGKMIDELEQDVDGTNSRLAAAQRKMNQVLKKAGMKGQMCIIVILTGDPHHPLPHRVHVMVMRVDAREEDIVYNSHRRLI